MSVSYQIASESYTYGHLQGDARRRNTRPTSNIAPRVINTFWFEFGDQDGAMGRGKREFRVDATYVGDLTEKQNYDFGFDGASEPRDESARAFWEAGKRDRAAGSVKLYYYIGGALPAGTRPAPAYVPKPNPNAANLPPVTVNPPAPSGGPNQPDVVLRSPQLPGPAVPPWAWPGGFGGGGNSGIIVYGPWGFLDVSKLQPVFRR